MPHLTHVPFRLIPAGDRSRSQYNFSSEHQKMSQQGPSLCPHGTHIGSISSSLHISSERHALLPHIGPSGVGSSSAKSSSSEHVSSQMHLSVLCVAVALPVDVRVKAQSELSSFGSSVIPLRSLIIVRGLILLSVSLKIVDSPIFLSFCHFISVCVCVRERKRERERERIKSRNSYVGKLLFSPYCVC